MRALLVFAVAVTVAAAAAAAAAEPTHTGSKLLHDDESVVAQTELRNGAAASEATGSVVSDGDSHWSPHRVLVLGSGGLIGSHLAQLLKDDGYQVFEARNRVHHDLRVPGAMDKFTYVARLSVRRHTVDLLRASNESIDVVFFLACEVGGSKFITSSQTDIQLNIMKHNVQMYQEVFGWAAQHRVPVIFTSSYLAASANSSTYAVVKLLGEHWCAQIPNCRVAKLWNVYGLEPLGLRSHVVSDWVGQCAKCNKALSLTDGSEPRQMMHVSDAVLVMREMMAQFPTIEQETHVTSGEWITVREIGARVSRAAQEALGTACNVQFPKNQPPVHRAQLEPHLNTPVHRAAFSAQLHDMNAHLVSMLRQAAVRGVAKDIDCDTLVLENEDSEQEIEVPAVSAPV